MARYSFKRCGVKNPKLCCMQYYTKKLYVIDVLTSKMLNDYLVISTDETPLNTIGNTDYFWTSKDIHQVHKRVIRKTGYSMIMAISNEKILEYRITNQKNNAFSYWTFINDMLTKLSQIPEYKLRIRMGKVLIFADNASIHRKPKVRDEVIKFNIELLYNVPYESAFNPIESVFKLIKKKIKNDYPCTITEVKSKYFSAIESIKTNDIVSSWKLSLKEMTKSMKAGNILAID